MSRLATWFRGSAAKPSSDGSSGVSSVDLLAKEMADIESAMAAAGHIMNDDIAGAEERLRQEDSVFHQLGLAVTTFMRSILGFEKDIMGKAAAQLAECEARSIVEMKKAQREINTGRNLYPPGTEFVLVNAQAQLMLAVVAVMHESLTEAIRGFYKMRKAFIALDAVMDAEAKMLRALRGEVTPEEIEAPLATDDKMPGSFDDDEFADIVRSGDGDSEVDVVEAVIGTSGTQNSSQGNGVPGTPPENLLENLDLDSMPPTPGEETECPPLELKALKSQATVQDTDLSLITNPIDVYIHSGASMCYGILLLVIGMVPPAFSRLLYIIGFKGDRKRGVHMLWRSTAVPNVNGAIAALILLSYYNGLLGYADILPKPDDIDADAEAIGYPVDRCAALLATMRERYPDSQLWRLEEARILASGRRLREAIEVLRSGTASKMRQVTAINNFELSISLLFAQDWPAMRSSFLRCVELNDWSHSLYYYMAGAAELELYRDALHGPAPDPEEGRRRKKSAEEYFRKAPTVAGKKRLMARQLPFEAFVIRKVQKWEDRAKELGIDLGDAVGVSPALEMVYLWNGAKRMSPELVVSATAALGWDRCTAAEDVVQKWRETPDEAAIYQVSMAALLRTQRKYEETKAILEDALKPDKYLFKGGTRDDYTLPAAHYEMAVLLWTQACDDDNWPRDGGERAIVSFRSEKAAGAKEWLDKVAKWETFTLDARFGMRIQTGLEVIRWFQNKQDAA